MSIKELFTNLLKRLTSIVPTSLKFSDFLDSEYDYSIVKKGSKLNISVQLVNQERKGYTYD